MIDGKQIWQAILKDNACMEEMPEGEQQDVMRQYIERRLLTVFGNLIDAPATATNVYRARIAHASAFILEGWFLRMIEASTEYRENPLRRAFLLYEIQLRSYAMLERLAPLQGDIFNFMLMDGKSDRKHLLELGVTAENIWQCVRGEMTIGELFAGQPYVFLKLYGKS
ncbi:MAG: hypothetical protein U9Q03_04895 [Patescibacteria group bacterium]|nr:hypothetical protein [Patescibacteria group bacterium]